MQSMLNVKSGSLGDASLSNPHTAADFQDQDEGNNKDRDRYQRHFWEPVVEGEVSYQPLFRSLAIIDVPSVGAYRVRGLGECEIRGGRVV